MKIYFKIFLIIVISLLIFCGCSNNVLELENTITTDIILEDTSATEMSENMNDKNDIEIAIDYLPDDIIEEFTYIFNIEKENQYNILKQDGCVKNATTAIEIATAIFNAVYEGYMRDFDFPLKAYYDNINNCWLVKTSFPENRTGGPKYIIINAINAEVIAIHASR